MNEWSSEEVVKLKELVANSNLTNKDIGRQLGRSYNGVVAKIYKLGIQRYNYERWSKKDVDKLKKILSTKNLSCVELGKIFNRHSSSISTKLKRLGIKKHYMLRASINTKNWTKNNMMWLAGLLEGEGCFSNHYGKNHPNGQFSIVLGMTDLDIIERAKSIGGCGYIYSAIRSEDRKPMWLWKVSKKAESYALIAALYSFMGIRRKSKMRECIETFKKARV